MTRPRTCKAGTMRQLCRILLVAIVLLSGGWSLARADAYDIMWLDMSTVPIGDPVNDGDVFYLPGYGNVEITYTDGLIPWRGQNADAQNGTIYPGGDRYSWTTFDALHELNNDAGNSTPVTYTVTYTFLSGQMPAGDLVLGVWGLGRLDSLYQDPQFITTITVTYDGTFLGDWDMGPTRGPTEFLLGTGSFVLRNSLLGNGKPNDPSFNTDLGVVKIAPAVSVLTLEVTHIGQDGIEFSVGRRYPVPEEEVIPTLTEWGLIIFCVLLFGWMAWVIVHRRKRVNVRI